MTEAPFFIGWESRLAASLRRFLMPVAVGLLAGFVAFAVLLGSAADDPAGPRFGLAPGAADPADLPSEGAIQGVLTTQPYPLLHLAQDAAHPHGRAILLAGDGKIGAPGDLAALEGRTVAVEGFMLRRGSITMLAIGEAPIPVEGAMAPPVTEPLGRWRIAGEVCDGKCAAGGMRPGTGIAHRACATLCLQGEIPSVFVASAPVAGDSFLLLANAQGQSAFPSFRHLIGTRVVLEGEVERRGGILVFRADFASVRVP